MNISLWNAQNAKQIDMQQQKTRETILKELKCKNFVQDATRELFTKRQNKLNFLKEKNLLTKLFMGEINA